MDSADVSERHARQVKQMSCDTTARNLRTSVSRIGSEKDTLETYSNHNQTDKAAFLNIGQLCVEERLGSKYPRLPGVSPAPLLCRPRNPPRFSVLVFCETTARHRDKVITHEDLSLSSL